MHIANFSESLLLFTSAVATFTRRTQSLHTRRELRPQHLDTGIWKMKLLDRNLWRNTRFGNATDLLSDYLTDGFWSNIIVNVHIT